MRENCFLPQFLGLVGSDSELLRRKSNFLRLSAAAFFVGSFANVSFDGGIGPWQSGLFGFYDENQQIVNLEHQPFFVHDTIGLKSLNNSNKLIIRFFPSVRNI
jgi:palmitoyl-protein thioesterase